MSILICKSRIALHELTVSAEQFILKHQIQRLMLTMTSLKRIATLSKIRILRSIVVGLLSKPHSLMILILLLLLRVLRAVGCI